MITLIKYKLDGTIVDENEVELNNLNNILGMKVKCTYKDGRKEIGYFSLNEDYYKNNKKNLTDYIELWTLKKFDKNKPNDTYEQEFRKLETNNLIKIEAILHSNPRWGTTPSNDFEFRKRKKKKICPKCGGKLVDIIYGMPSLEIFEKAERKKVALGGCEIIGGVDQPIYHCYNCDLDFDKYMTNETDLFDHSKPLPKTQYFIEELLGENILLITKDFEFTSGIFVSYQRPEDNEEECWTIDIEKDGTIYSFLETEIDVMFNTK